MNAKMWCFDPLDSWFFREARSAGATGGGELSSVFPPPARTVAGAVRYLIGQAQEVDWDDFIRADGCPELKGLIGVGDDLGQLRLTGPYPLWKGQRLYPAPLHLLFKVEPGRERPDYVFLQPGEPVKCDLGKVRLPILSRSLRGAKPLENIWLDRGDLERVLCCEPPVQLYRAHDLYAEEPRLGIARNNSHRTVIEGLLYQTRHIRLQSDLSIGITVVGEIPEPYPLQGLTRFGGEGRAGAMMVQEPPPSAVLSPPAVGQYLVLVLLTHADFGGDVDDGWLLPGFTCDQEEDVRVWRGQLHGVDLTLHMAVLGKAVREGGWDFAGRCPRPVTSLIPAGSVYFCTVAGDPNVAIKTLHGQHIGNDTALGRGELAVGRWPILTGEGK